MKEENYWRIQYILHGERAKPEYWIADFARLNGVKSAASGVDGDQHA